MVGRLRGPPRRGDVFRQDPVHAELEGSRTRGLRARTVGQFINKMPSHLTIHPFLVVHCQCHVKHSTVMSTTDVNNRPQHIIGQCVTNSLSSTLSSGIGNVWLLVLVKIVGPKTLGLSLRNVQHFLAILKDCINYIPKNKLDKTKRYFTSM